MQAVLGISSIWLGSPTFFDFLNLGNSDVVVMRTIVVIVATLLLSGCLVIDIANPNPNPRPLHQASDYSVLTDMIAMLSTGSVVEVVQWQPDGDRLIKGTVLKASSNGVALMNCQTKHFSPRQPQALVIEGLSVKVTEKGTTKLPVQWVARGNILSLQILSPPSIESAVPALDIDTDDHEIPAKTKLREIDANSNLDSTPGRSTVSGPLQNQ